MDDLCSYVIHSLETGVERRINLNVKNTGIITNLTNGCCVEYLSGRQRRRSSLLCWRLPPQCAAIERKPASTSNCWQSKPSPRRARKNCYRPFCRPLTSSILSIDQTEAMFNELFAWEKDYVKRIQIIDLESSINTNN